MTADGRIAFGARGSYYFGSRIRTDFGPEARDTKWVWELLLNYFPALRGVPMTHSWGGAMALPRNEKPFVFLDGKRRFGWAGGHASAGVAPSCMAGETLADLVLGLDTARVHEPWGGECVAAALGARAPALAGDYRRESLASVFPLVAFGFDETIPYQPTPPTTVTPPAVPPP